MASVTVNMGLTRWDASSDPYDHVQLAANFTAIDLHDHSTGKGVKIGTGGISNGAITNALLASNSVDGSKIIDGSITSADLSPSVLSDTLPLGAVLAWDRNPGDPIPSKWALCDGTAWASISNDLGRASGTIIDLRNRFILGSATSGTGVGTSTPPAERATGGAHTLALGHTHSVNPHTHTVAAHTHTVSSHSHSIAPHSHTVNSHSHTVNSHSHTVNSHSHQVDPHAHDHVLPIFNLSPSGIIDPLNPDMEVFDPTSSRLNGFGSSVAVGDEFTAGTGRRPITTTYSSGSVELTRYRVTSTSVAPATNASSPGTSAASPGTDAQSPSTDSVGLVTDSQSPGTSSTALTTDADVGTTTASGLSTVDSRPQFVGLLYIMKVKS